MKTLYLNTPSQIFYLIALFAFLAACAPSLTYNEALSRNQNKIEDQERLKDATFLVNAKSYNLLATELTEAAMASGYSATVVEFARQNHEEHLEMAKEINKLARQQKIDLPTEMSDAHQVLLSQVSSSGRRDFDRTFIRVLETISEDINEKYNVMATDALNEDVRAFAARKLDMFKSQQSQLELADQELLNTY